MYLVDSKSSKTVVKVSAGLIFSSYKFKIVQPHQIVHRYTFTFQWMFRVQLLTNSEPQISAKIALNQSFTVFSSKVSVRVLILKEFSFVCV